MSAAEPAAVDLALPRWAYVPGEVAEADNAALARAKALAPLRFEGFVPAHHPALIYGLALNDAGFFWESHEILEAVWAAAPQGGRDRILLRACIQIANANLKLRMKRPRAVARLLSEALAELDELVMRKATGAGDSFADMFLGNVLATLLRGRLAQSVSLEAEPIVFGII